MGLLKHLLFWPVTGPMFLTEFALGKVDGVVREQLTDDSSVKADLLELQLRQELGEIDDEEYAAQEAALLRRLREVREWRDRFGMGVSGGVVRVAREEPAPGPGLDAGPVAPGAPAAPGDPGAPSESGAGAPPAVPRVADPGSATIEINLDWE